MIKRLINILKVNFIHFLVHRFWEDDYKEHSLFLLKKKCQVFDSGYFVVTSRDSIKYSVNYFHTAAQLERFIEKENLPLDGTVKIFESKLITINRKSFFDYPKDELKILEFEGDDSARAKDKIKASS